MNPCWMGVLYGLSHALGSRPEVCLMCAAKKSEDTAKGAR